MTSGRSGPEKANLGRHAGMLCGCGCDVAERSRIDGYETDESSHSKQETTWRASRHRGTLGRSSVVCRIQSSIQPPNPTDGEFRPIHGGIVRPTSVWEPNLVI